MSPMTTKVAIMDTEQLGRAVDAVACQDDMGIIGVTKTRPAFGCDLAVGKGHPFTAHLTIQKIAAFAPAGYECHGD